MASSLDFVEYVCQQISDVGNIRYRKMFGDYMIYVDNKPILLLCNNVIFVKMLDCIKDKMNDAERDFPYEGAKEHYILNIENSDFCKEIIADLLPFVPVPKPRKKS